MIGESPCIYIHYAHIKRCRNVICSKNKLKNIVLDIITVIVDEIFFKYMFSDWRLNFKF